MRRAQAILLITLLGWAVGAGAQPRDVSDELASLREELEALRADYQTRLSDLESRIEALSMVSQAPAPVPASPQALNPQISVIGDFLGTASQNVPELESPSLDLREVELAFQARLDPFARADFFVTVPSLEDVEMEEGYVTFLTLPSDFLVRLGKVRVPFGRANVDHRPETFAVERPDVIQAYFGEEGLSEVGATISRLLPNPWDVFMELELDILDGSNDVSFGGGSAKDLLYNVHYRSFFDLTPQQNLNVGLSFATGVNTDTRRTRLGGFDVTYNWKPLALGKYRSFLWQTELIAGGRDTDTGWIDSWGLYSFARYQLGRRWYVGGRFDYSQMPDDPDFGAVVGSALVEFFASEFQRLRLQYKVTDRTDMPLSHQLFFQWYYLIGTHGAHKF